MILVTGATGFLGSRLLAALLSAGHQVVIIKRSFSKTARICNLLDHHGLVVIDIDKTEPEVIFKNHGIDTIIHTATQYGRSGTPLYAILEANLILPLRLAELGILHGVQCFINTDSYFNKGSASYSHLLDYALSKKSLLTWLDKLSGRIKTINVVLEHIYGPYDDGSKFVESLIRRVAIDRSPHVALTHGHQRRDFIYLDDVVAAYLHLVEYGRMHKFKFKSFDLGSGYSVPVRDFALLVKTLSGSGTELGFGDIPYRADEIMDSHAQIAELQELGWNPTTSLEHGIGSILKAYGVTALNTAPNASV